MALSCVYYGALSIHPPLTGGEIAEHELEDYLESAFVFTDDGDEIEADGRAGQKYYGEEPLGGIVEMLRRLGHTISGSITYRDDDLRGANTGLIAENGRLYLGTLPPHLGGETVSAAPAKRVAALLVQIERGADHDAAEAIAELRMHLGITPN